MPKQLAPELRSLADDQRGIVLSGQAMQSGLSRSAVRRRLKSGEWRRRGPGVYATFTGEPSRDADLWTAVLLAGPGAMLSHETAAEVHGFADQPSRLIHVTVPAKRRPAQRKQLRGIVIHRSDQSRPHLRPQWEPPRTTAEDTVLDLIAAAGTFDDAYGWISRALGRQISATPLLREALARRTRMRWRAWISEALNDADEGISSPLERHYVYGVERAHGLPKAKRQAKRRHGSGNRYLDNRYEAYGVIVELDGEAAHPAEGRWKDTHRDNANVAQGDNGTLRYGWPDTTENRCRTAIQVADVLSNHGWTGQLGPCGPECPVAQPT